MKAAQIAFAAALVFATTAFAGDKDPRPSDPATKDQQETLDTNPTGSIKTGDQAAPKGPRLGVDLNPFSFGSFY